MTVCIAALCNNGTYLVGAADRMLTAGDIEFEPPQTKITSLTSAIVIMTASHAVLQTELIEQLAATVLDRVNSDPDNWLRVRDAALLYNQFYNRELNRRAESSILAPLGLTSDTFIKRQREMDSDLANKLASEIVNFDMPEVETIITGIDPTGAHIYSVHGPNISCRDTIGFAAIGAGSGHANSQFMFSGHTRFKPGPETFLLVFTAKKHSEAAPGVGIATDMWVMGSGLGTFSAVDPETIKHLEKINKDNQKMVARAAKKSERRINEYIQGLSDAGAASKAQTATEKSGEGTTDTVPEGKEPANKPNGKDQGF